MRSHVFRAFVSSSSIEEGAYYYTERGHHKVSFDGNKRKIIIRFHYITHDVGGCAHKFQGWKSFTIER